MTTRDFVSNLPDSLYLAEQVRQLDKIAIDEYGIPGYNLMQKAARFAFHQLIKAWPETKTMTVICGAGNNAGDGYLIASIAAKQGIEVHVVPVSNPEKLTGDAKTAYESCVASNLEINAYHSNEALIDHTRPTPHIVVDALLGTGLSRQVSGEYLDAINTINASPLPVLSVDIPSGLCADTGQPKPIAVNANITSTFIGNKLGLLTGRGRDFAGSVFFSDLNVPSDTYQQFKPEVFCPTLKSLLDRLPAIKPTAHKGTHGRALLIGGNHGFGGAIMLASRACARMGAGLTACFTRPEHQIAQLQSQPEIMTHSDETAMQALINSADVIAIGPGLGQDDWAKTLFNKALQSEAFLVIDADALNLLAHENGLSSELQRPHVLTPHPGEAARLLNSSTIEIEKDRLHSVRALSNKFGGSVVLKGSGSLIHHQSTSQTSLCRYGNPGMASGGMGDVLTGMITGLLCRYGNETNKALIIECATLLHAYAADVEANNNGGIGMLAGDIIDTARSILNRKFEQHA